MSKEKVRLTKSKCQKWIKALRSGEYKQCEGRLRKGNQNGSTFCCLGIAEKVIGLPRENFGELDIKHIEDLDHLQQSRLIKMNDGGKSFSYIAGYIERYILPKLKD